MKRSLLLFLFIFTSTAFAEKAKEEVCFNSLYQVDLLLKMGKQTPHGQCLDLKEHFISSLSFARQRGKRLRESISNCKSRTEAKDFCARNKKVPICDTLSFYLENLDLNNKDSKHKASSEFFISRRILKSVSKAEFGTIKVFMEKQKLVQNEKSSGHCLVDKEFEIALKYTYILNEKYRGDNGLANKVLDSFNVVMEDDQSEWDLSFFEEVQDHCRLDTAEVSTRLYKGYTSLVKESCLGELSQNGFSFYDKNQIYCGGETPLACTLFKRVPASIK